MNQEFLNAMHQRRDSIKQQLGDLNRIVYAMDDLGFDKICDKLDAISQQISADSQAIVDAYYKALDINVQDSMSHAADTLAALARVRNTFTVGAVLEHKQSISKETRE